MSAIKRGQDNQIMFTVYVKDTGVQSSGATASQMSAARTLYGTVHGGNTAAVAKTLSRAPSLVRSGIFRQSIKSAEVSNFDEILVHLEGNTSLIIPFNGLFPVMTFDDSDLLSALEVIQSMASDAASAAQRAASQAILGTSLASDAASAAAQANSRTLVIESQVSDVYSLALLIQSLASDAASAAAQGNSRALVNQSVVSDLYSAALLIQSLASDAASAAAQANSRALVNQSVVSDLYSAALLIQSLASDAASAAAQGNSRALVNQSVVSDLYSAALLIQSLASDAHSAAAQANSRALLTQSMASDAASAAAQANSRVLLNQSRISDVYSLLSDYVSDFGSRIPANLTTLTAVPADAPSLNAAIMFLFHAQKFQTRRNASTVMIGASDGSTMASAAVSFNAGTSTFVRGTFT